MQIIFDLTDHPKYIYNNDMSTPKEFLKVIRFQSAVRQIEQQDQVDWSAIAYDCGFYDQSHFIADFKKFSGYTPSQYLKIKGSLLNYIPVQ